jgi:hypothetical protein
VEYPPTAEIMQEIENIEDEISVQMEELKKLLGL